MVEGIDHSLMDFAYLLRIQKQSYKCMAALQLFFDHLSEKSSHFFFTNSSEGVDISRAGPSTGTPSESLILKGGSFITTSVWDQNPRSHHKGATGRLRTGDQRYPVLSLPTWTRHKFADSDIRFRLLVAD